MATSISNDTRIAIRIIQLRTELEDRFADLHQMLDVHRQHLFDKLTELEDNFNKYEKHTEAICKLKNSIESIKADLQNDILADAHELALPIFEQKLEKLEKENIKSVNIECLKLTCNVNLFQNCVNSISISDTKKEIDYRKRAVPLLSKVKIGTKKGEISTPTGIAIDNDSKEVYICDDNPAHGSRIHVFSLEGMFIRQFGEGYLKCPHSIALSSSDVLVANSKDSHCLMKFNKDGTFVKKTGSRGIGDGQFNFPHGLCVANDLVYVCDKLNNRIQAFDFNLCFSFKFTSSELSEPIGIKFHSNQLFVSKQTGSTIFVYSLEGAFINYLQLTGEGSTMSRAYYFTMDFAGNYLFSEFNSNCIKIFSPSGEYIASLGKQHLQSPHGLASDTQGHIICVCLKTGAVFQKF